MKTLLTTIVWFFILFGNVNGQTLDFYIETALKNSPLLHDYNNQLLAGRLDSLLIRSAIKPQISQISQVLYPPTGAGWGYDDAITNGGNYSAVVNVTQSLFNKRHIAGQFQSLELINQTLKINAKITILDLKKSITAQYLTAYADFTQYQFTQTVVARLSNEQKTVKELVDKGVYLVTDYMNLQVLSTAQKIAISQAWIQLKNDIAILNFLCGVSNIQEINLSKPEIIVTKDFNPVGSPLFAQFRIDSLKNINLRQITDLNYKPKLSAFADAGFNSIVPGNIPHNFGTSVGVNFSVPIYDGKQRKLQYDKINLAENTRIYYSRYYYSQYKLQFDQLTNQLKLSDGLLLEMQNQLKEQELLIDLYRVELDKGLVRFLDYLTVLNNFITAKDTYLIAEINRLQIINQMNYLK